MKINEQIKEIIPFVDENFITFPLCEEGNYTPFLNFWQFFGGNVRKVNKLSLEFEIKAQRIFIQFGYMVEINRINSNLFEYKINPILIYSKKGKIIYLNKNWSIEEMIELIKKCLQ